MKRRRLDGEEEEREKVVTLEVIRASISKGETRLDEWETAIAVLKTEANLFAIRGELAQQLPNLFKGTPLEDLVTSPGKISISSLEREEPYNRDDPTDFNALFGY